MARRIALVMAGGGGARLWPASTSQRPKQLLDPLLEDQEQPYGASLLARTVARLAGIAHPNDVWVVTGTSQRSGVARALPDLPSQRILTEPCARNTAAAIALSALYLRAHVGDEDPTLLVFPADHHVGRLEAFQECLRTACAHAEQTDAIVTLGITPHEPSTAYGYIERTDTAVTPMPQDAPEHAVYPVSRFVEKPSEPRAREFLETGHFLWNSGIFVMRLSRIEQELRTHCPTIWSGLHPVAQALASGDLTAAQQASHTAYRQLPAVPIDVAVMEKAQGLRVVSSDIDWTDLGSWEAVYELAAKDPQRNAAIASAAPPVMIDAHGCLAWGDSAQIAIVGLDDVAVVQSGDRILVMPRERAQDVRLVVRELLDREPQT